MSVRLKRLSADEALVRSTFASHPHIRIVDAIGDPPERYRIEYHVRGLVVVDGLVTEKESHLVEVFLTLAYPRQAPQCRMLTPVFHPNIAPHAICIGDHWSAGQSLATVLVRIGEMLAFQSYNVKSPLNGAAARWAEENLAGLPIDPVDLWMAPDAGPARQDSLPVPRAPRPPAS